MIGYSDTGGGNGGLNSNGEIRSRNCCLIGYSDFRRRGLLFGYSDTVL